MIPQTATGKSASLVDAFTDQLATPTGTEQHWHAQSLAKGAAGVALLHIERAHAGLGTDGAAGLTLALHTATRTTPPISGWDSCLLIN
ncbi:MAG: hypothetical protein ACRDTJ_09330 [Pseudonocardiaceae bacterium]